MYTIQQTQHFEIMQSVEHMAPQYNQYKHIMAFSQYTWCPKKSYQQPAAGATVHRPNHQLALLVSGIFLVVFTKTKQDQMFPSHFYGKIWPHSTVLCLRFLFVSYFSLGHPVYGLKYDYKNVSGRFRPILLPMLLSQEELSFNALTKMFKAGGKYPLYNILNSCLDILKSRFV